MQDDLAEQVLHVAATRPALLWGVPFPLAILIIQITGIVGVFHWAGPLVGPPLWVLAAILVRRDYNMPGIVLLWWNTSARCWDAEIWGGSTVSPFPVHMPKRLRGIAHGPR